MTDKFELILDKFINQKETALVGRNNGECCVAQIQDLLGNLSDLESQHDVILVVAPKRIVTINKSFFLGMFELRIFELGKDRFLSKYEFNASEYILKKIPRYVDDALRSSSMRDILGV